MWRNMSLRRFVYILQSGSTGNQLICLFTFLVQKKTTSCIEKKTKEKKERIRETNRPSKVSTKDKSKNAL